MKKLITIVVGILILASIGVGIFFINQRAGNFPQKEVAQKNKVQLKLEKQEFLYTAWSPDWALNPTLESLETNSDNLDSVSVVWFFPQKDGSLENKVPKNSNQLLTKAKEKNLEVLVSVASFDHETLTPIFQENLDKHVEAILSEVDLYDFDGVDIDYESTKLSDKEKYFEFLEKLGQGLKSREKRFTVAVLPQWEGADYASFKETRQVQDWTRIAEFADEIRLMTYDYTSAVSEFPGPIAPLDWQKKVLDYGVSKVDPKKLSLGIHLYSYEKWVEIQEEQENLGFNDPKLAYQTDFTKQGYSEIPSRSYSYDVVQRVLRDYKGEVEDYQGEKIYRYSKVNDDSGLLENRVLTYIDKEGVDSRIALAKEYGLSGVSYWRLGGEGELVEG